MCDRPGYSHMECRNEGNEQGDATLSGESQRGEKTMSSRIVRRAGRQAGCFCLFTALLFSAAHAAAAETDPARNPQFLKRQGAALTLAGRPFRNIGANMPNLFELFLHNRDAEADTALSEAHTVGIRFARCFGSTWGPADFHLFEDDPARWIDAYDRMLAAAARHGIALAPSLLFNARMIPEYITARSGEPQGLVDLYTPGSPANRLAMRYVAAIVARFKDDPRILFWEIGNEYNLDADLSQEWKRRPANDVPTSDQVRDFLADCARAIKRIDRNHLVTSGNADMRPYAWHIRQAMLAQRSKPDALTWPMDWRKDRYEQYLEMLTFYNPAPLDIVSVHQYPAGKETANWLMQDDSRAAMLAWTRKACDRIGRPLFLGEFGDAVFEGGRERQSAWLEDCLDQLARGSAPLSAVWTWEYHSEDPQQDRLALSSIKTPKLAALLAGANRALTRSGAASRRSTGSARKGAGTRSAGRQHES